MEYASFSGTLRVIFYIIATYYIFKFLARLLFPVLVKKAVEKAAENFEQQRQYQQGNYQSARATNNDEIIYDRAKSDKPRETKKVGEYIDFEEIK